MIRVPTLRFAILALTCAAVLLLVVPAFGEQAPTSIQPSLTLKDASVQDVIRLIVKALGSDVLMTDDVQGTISLEVSQKSPEEILDLVCAAKKLYWWKERGVYVVSGTPRSAPAEPKSAENQQSTPAPRVNRERAVVALQYFNAQDLAYLFGGAREPHSDAYRVMEKQAYPYGFPPQAVGPPIGGQTAVKGGYGAKAQTTADVSKNPFAELSQVVIPGVIQPGVTDQPQVSPGQQQAEEEAAAEEEQYINEQAPLAHLLPEGLSYPVAFTPLNALIVQGPAQAIEDFRKLVELLDVRVPQIMVEAQFVEMRIVDAAKFGIDWSWISGQTTVDVTGIAQGGNIGISYSKGRFTSLLQALLQNTRARVINAPRLATMNGQPVTFQLSQTFFFFTTSSVVQPPGFAGSQVITNEVVNPVPIVTQFTVLPQVNGDNSITVDVTTVITDVASFATSPSGQSIPQPTSTTLPTRLRVENGETIVMGGIVRKQSSKVTRKIPLLGDIPLLGKALFTGTDYTSSDSELLIFLTAYIMPEKGAGGERVVPQTQFQTLPLGTTGK